MARPLLANLDGDTPPVARLMPNRRRWPRKLVSAKTVILLSPSGFSAQSD
jgi:hypothetical protein